MKLLFDANLSPKLVGRLSDLFPGSAHVFGVGLERLKSDEALWQYAADHDFVVVTADSDFLGLAAMPGASTRVVHLQHCDFRTARVEALLRRNAVRIAEFGRSSRTVLTIRNYPKNE